MFKFLLGVLLLASNFLVVSRAIAAMDAGSRPDAMTMPIRGRARWAALTLALALTAYGGIFAGATNAAPMTILFKDDFNRPDSLTLGAPLIGGSWTQFNQITAPNGIFAPSFTEISNNALGFHFTGTPDGFPAVSAALAQPVGIFPVTISFDFIPTAPDERSGYSVGLMTAQGFKTNPLGSDIPHDGIGVFFSRSSFVFSNSTMQIESIVNGTRVILAVDSLPFQLDGNTTYHFEFTINGNGTVSATVTHGVDTSTVIASAVLPSSPLTHLFVTDEDAGISNANPNATQIARFDDIQVIGSPLPGSLPVAVNESATTAANTPVTIDLTAGASGNPTSAALAGTPVGGTVTGFPATTVTFTPTTGFTGAASFQFTLANAFGTSNTATATITVTPGPAPSISSVSPNPPTGSDSTQAFTINGSNFVTGANVTLRDLTAGQTFPNRVASSFSSTQIVINPVFTTAAHSWSVEVINPDGQSSGQFGFLVIAPPNLPPVAKDQDVPPITAGTSVKIDLSKNATGGIPTGAKTSKPKHGTISATFGTSVIYTADACYTGPDSFTFRLTNDFGPSNLAKVTITVNPAGAPAIEVHLIDPYLLDAYKTNPRKITEDSLFAAYNNPAVQAKGLVADGVSAAIAVVKTNTCSGDVTVFTTLNGITLLTYDPTFLNLKTPPMPGEQILPITAAELAAKGGFAAVLVQAPIGPLPFPLFTGDVTPIDVAAQQGDLQGKAEMFLVPPPVVLVHGIWGDRTGLGGQDGAGFGTFGQEGLAGYLEATIPWLGNPNFVQVVCYSKFFGFNADKDPILDSVSDVRASDSCEQTSRDALASRIYGLLGYLDDKHYVGSRVDVVAHSMGGLAARNYASQDWYGTTDPKRPSQKRSFRNRGQGQFHEIITLDTPELGSELAPFLLAHKDCTKANLSIIPLPTTLWDTVCIRNFCIPGDICIPDNPFITVAQCFAKFGFPLAAPGPDLTTGAVFSLLPHGPSLRNPKLPGPNIPGADWRAIGSDAPHDSALEDFLNELIAAIYPQTTPTCSEPVGSPHTIDKILLDDPPKNDAIVRLSSQLPVPGIEADHVHKFEGLSHTGLPDLARALLPPGLLNDNVLDCADVNRLAACWLSRSGNSACLAGVLDIPACVTPVSASTTARANKTAGLAASFTPVASKAAAANTNIVPMPHIVTKHPRSVDRLTLRMPAGLELGKPFDLRVNTGSGGLPELHVVQSSETGTPKEVPVTISRVEGQTVHLKVTPTFFGNTRFQVTAAYPDGGVATKEVAATADYPSGPPMEFHADELAFAGIPLPFPKNPADPGNPTLRLQPWAKWDSTGPRVYLKTSDVSYTIDPASGSSVIELSPTNGIIRGRKVGTARVAAQFRALPSQVQVNVVDKQQ